LKEIDRDIFKEKLPGVHQTIGYVNALSKPYQPMKAIKAFETISSEFPNWSLKVIGFGAEYKVLVDYIQCNNLEKKVHLYGPLSDKEIFDVFKRVDICLVPSSFQNDEAKTAQVCLMGAIVIVPIDHELLNEFEDSGIVPFEGENDLVAKLRSQITKLKDLSSTSFRANRLEKFSS